MIEITERELPNYAGKRIILEAVVNGEKLWRVWYEGSVSTLEKKRKLLQRDIELAQHGNQKEKS
jgi:hypothetical protein